MGFLTIYVGFFIIINVYKYNSTQNNGHWGKSLLNEKKPNLSEKVTWH